MAQARVELASGKSFTARGVPFVKGKPRIVTSPDDIAYYKRCSQLKVTMLKSPTPAPAPEPAAPAKKAKAAPAPVAADDEDDSDEDDEESAPQLPPWKPNDSKKTLQAACEARGIAYTPDDKAAVLVQMLKEHDELAS